MSKQWIWNDSTEQYELTELRDVFPMMPVCEWCGEEYDEDDFGADEHFCSDKCRQADEDNLNSHLGDGR